MEEIVATICLSRCVPHATFQNSPAAIRCLGPDHDSLDSPLAAPKSVDKFYNARGTVTNRYRVFQETNSSGAVQQTTCVALACFLSSPALRLECALTPDPSVACLFYFWLRLSPSEVETYNNLIVLGAIIFFEDDPLCDGYRFSIFSFLANKTFD